MAKPGDKMTVTMLEDEDVFDIAFDDFDYHLRPWRGGFVLDIFHSGVSDPNEAHEDSVEFDSIGEALGFILTGKH